MAQRPHAEGLERHWLYICRLQHSALHTPINITTTTTTVVLRPFVRDYPGEPVPEETLTHPPSWSSSNLYQLLPSTTIHSILPVQTACLAVFLHNLSPCPLWSTSWSGALHLIFHTFLHPITLLFTRHAHTIATCFAVVSRLYYLFLVFLSTPYLQLLSFTLTLHVHLTILISARWKCHVIFFPDRHTRLEDM